MTPKKLRETERKLASGIISIPVPAHTLPPARSVNAYAVGQEELAIVDPAKFSGSGRGPLFELLRNQVESKVKIILLTHAHIDHCGAAPELASIFKVAIAGHKLELEKFAQAFGSDFRLIPLTEGDILKIGPLRVEAVHTPGHTSGHLCYYIRSLGALFSGDMVLGFGTSLVKPPDGDMAEYMRSLEKLRSMHIQVLLPGHGPIIWDPRRKIEEYIAHRLMRERKIVEAVKSGYDLPSTIARIVYNEEDMEVHGYDLMPRAELMVLAHLLKLEKEGTVVREASCRGLSFKAKA